MPVHVADVVVVPGGVVFTGDDWLLNYGPYIALAVFVVVAVVHNVRAVAKRARRTHEGDDQP